MTPHQDLARQLMMSDESRARFFIDVSKKQMASVASGPISQGFSSLSAEFFEMEMQCIALGSRLERVGALWQSCCRLWMIEKGFMVRRTIVVRGCP